MTNIFGGSLEINMVIFQLNFFKFDSNVSMAQTKYNQDLGNSFIYEVCLPDGNSFEIGV